MSANAPRRRPSKAVFRRRRLLVIVLLLIVVAAVVWVLVAQPWRGMSASASTSPKPTHSASASPSPSVSSTPSPSESATPEASETPAATEAPAASEATPGPTGTAKPCTGRDVTVEAHTDKNTYASGQNPLLSMTLTNASAKACTINVGTTTQKFTITSGNDTWWTSTDCQTEPSDMVVTLAAGQTVTSAAPVTWDRTRSSVSTCGDGSSRPHAAGSGASYHLAVEIGGIRSGTTAQFLLY